MDLFAERRIVTVTQLTALIRELLEDNFNHVWVEGEVSNLACPSSGHVYFTLKDAGATVRCVMFRNSARAMKFHLNDGIKILLRARLTVYDQRGDYQLIAEYAEPQGLGALQLAFQQMRERLAKEGLFAESLKKPIPSLPSAIGVVTSPTGAAIHDILNVIGRRHATLQILIAPTKVQGEGAAAEIAAAIADLNRYRGVDVIIVARGGGAIEDLWAFNEEVVARAIFASKIPVISAVGHEVDVTISDLVADLRAPTPSAAAELVVNSKSQLLADCDSLNRRLVQAMQRLLSDSESKVEILKLSLKDPEVLVERFMQRLDDLQQRAESSLTALLQAGQQRITSAENSLRLHSPGAKMKEMASAVEKLSLKLKSAMLAKAELSRSSLASFSGRLEALSPLSVLQRGYAVVTKPPLGSTVHGVLELAIGETVDVRFADGTVAAEVVQINDHEPL